VLLISQFNLKSYWYFFCTLRYSYSR